MWTSTIIAVLLASTSSASFLGPHCPVVVDAVSVTSTLSITVAAATVTVTQALSPTEAYASPAECLSDAQATSIVSSWNAILTHPDRTVANATAQALINDEFLRTSDSINSLIGLPLGNATYSGKEAFITSKLNSPPDSLLTTLDMFHDCSRIVVYWAVNGVGSGAQEIRGVDLLYLTDDKSQVWMAMTEFNSLAWAKDIGWTIQKSDGSPY
ncbi:hypothetical protein H2200_000254 [Cladophialophora chaetospira]|uniref:NTF2-like domain-containing protein n=1 Tax=Cladophialophora chaetospira TaxID=386627 RepID=A0AA38XN26_9EURO|nr:hypothetical protein H2200_000254 [Cladophialophora chaetospira]